MDSCCEIFPAQRQEPTHYLWALGTPSWVQNLSGNILAPNVGTGVVFFPLFSFKFIFPVSSQRGYVGETYLSAAESKGA